MLDMIFSQHDLAWLDDLLPEKEKKKDDDKKKSKGKEKEKRRSKADDSEEEVRNCLLLPPAGGQESLHRFLTTCARVFAGQRSHLLQPLAQLGVRPGPQVLCPPTAHPLQRPHLSR